MLVEQWCFRKYEDLLGVCGHFSATVKLPIPGGGRDLRMLGSYPQDPPPRGIDTIANEQITAAYYAKLMTDQLLAVHRPRLWNTR